MAQPKLEQGLAPAPPLFWGTYACAIGAFWGASTENAENFFVAPQPPNSASHRISAPT